MTKLHSEASMIKEASITRFRELTERREPTGRHYIFEVSGKNGYVGYLVNRLPYDGDVVNNPGDMYGRVCDYSGEAGKRVGSYSVDWNAVDNVLGKGKNNEKKVDIHSVPVVAPTDDLKKHTQPELPGLIMDQTPPRKPGHWASTVTADTWTKGQVYCDDDGCCYDVGALVLSTEHNEVVPVKVSKLSSQLSENAWGEPESPLSPFDVMAAPTSSERNMKHMAKIRTADLSKPILIRMCDGVVMDGNHRLARCVFEGRDRILAVYVHDEQMSGAKV